VGVGSQKGPRAEVTEKLAVPGNQNILFQEEEKKMRPLPNLARVKRRYQGGKEKGTEGASNGAKKGNFISAGN